MKRIFLILSVLLLAVSSVHQTLGQSSRHALDQRCWLVDQGADRSNANNLAGSASAPQSMANWLTGLANSASVQGAVLVNSAKDRWDGLSCQWYAVAQPWYHTSLDRAATNRAVIDRETFDPSATLGSESHSAANEYSAANQYSAANEYSAVDEYWAYYQACDHWGVTWGAAFRRTPATAIINEPSAAEPRPQITLIVLRPVDTAAAPFNRYERAIVNSLKQNIRSLQSYYDQARQMTYRFQFAMLKMQQVAADLESQVHAQPRPATIAPLPLITWNFGRVLLVSPSLRMQLSQQMGSAGNAIVRVQQRFQAWCGGWQWQQLKFELESY